MSNELIESRPSYLANHTGDSQDALMRQYSKPPLIKIVQPQTKAPVKPPHSDGDVVLMPSLSLISKLGQPFDFVPLAFFPSWVTFNPISASDLSAVREFTTNPKSDLAKLVKRRINSSPCPEAPTKELKHRGMLNFFCMVEASPLPVIMTFMGGEYKTGEAFIAMLQNRGCAKYCCRFRAATSLHSGKGFSWYGFDIGNASEPWVEESLAGTYGKLASSLLELITSDQVEVDLEVSSESSSESEF